MLSQLSYSPTAKRRILPGSKAVKVGRYLRLVRRLPSPCGPASVPYRLVLKQLVYAAITKRAAKQDPARYTGMRPPRAGMAELADAKVSKTFGRKPMGVRSPLPAPLVMQTGRG